MQSDVISVLFSGTSHLGVRHLASQMLAPAEACYSSGVGERQWQGVQQVRLLEILQEEAEMQWFD